MRKVASEVFGYLGTEVQLAHSTGARRTVGRVKSRHSHSSFFQPSGSKELEVRRAADISPSLNLVRQDDVQ
jgi:hypothetical protein